MSCWRFCSFTPGRCSLGACCARTWPQPSSAKRNSSPFGRTTTLPPRSAVPECHERPLAPTSSDVPQDSRPRSGLGGEPYRGEMVALDGLGERLRCGRSRRVNLDAYQPLRTFHTEVIDAPRVDVRDGVGVGHQLPAHAGGAPVQRDLNVRTAAEVVPPACARQRPQLVTHLVCRDRDVVAMPGLTAG